MIVTMRTTSSAQVAGRLVKLREEGGVVALGRVMTLVILPRDEEEAERAIQAANAASHEHPARVIVVQPHLTSEDEAGVDAQIRLGGDAGASEVVVLRPYGPEPESADTLIMPLLLSDAPIVAWWPHVPDEAAADTPVGRIAQRRITYAVHEADGTAALRRLAEHYRPGDTDLAWAGVTLWRGLLAASLDDGASEEVTAARVRARRGHPSAQLLAAWVALQLGVPVELGPDEDETAPGITRVEVERPSGTLVLSRPGAGHVATLHRPGLADQEVNLARRGVVNALVEDLRRLDEDVVYGRVLREGLPRVQLVD